MALKISQLTALSTTYKDTDIIEVSVDAGAGAFVTRKMTFLQLRTAFTKLEANLDVNSFQITSASNGNIIIRPNGSGAVLIGGNSTQATELRFMEDSDNGTNYVAMKVAAALAASTTYTLPSADGTSGQVLSTNGSGTLSWATAGGGSGITVGTTAVTSGTVGRIFFQGSGDVVQQDSTLFWDNTNKRLGVGATPSSSVRLDVRAQGALSTDIAFRVRNSGDTKNIFAVNGDDSVVYLSGINGGISITRTDAYNNTLTEFNDAFGTNQITLDTLNQTIFSRSNIRIGSKTGDGYLGMVSSGFVKSLKLGDVWGTTWFDLNGDIYNGGSSLTMRASTNNNTNYIKFRGYANANEVVISDQGNIGVGQTTYGTSAKYVIAIANGTAPTTSPVDAYQQYSADITAGNAAPHFRTENGNIIKIYQETTGVAAATLVGGGGTALTDTDTFDGYTLKQIVKALRNQGLLA